MKDAHKELWAIMRGYGAFDKKLVEVSNDLKLFIESSPYWVRRVSLSFMFSNHLVAFGFILRLLVMNSIAISSLNMSRVRIYDEDKKSYVKLISLAIVITKKSKIAKKIEDAYETKKN